MARQAVKALSGGLLFVSAIWVMAAGCSSSTSDNPSSPDASATCPRSVAEAADAPCSIPDQDCPIGYACGNTPEQAHCTCTKGKFACVDATPDHNRIAKGSDPQCVGPGQPNDKECPPAETGTEAKSCKTPGLLCHYVGVQCPENQVPNVDTCQCTGAPAGGLQFHCEPKGCNPRSDASDDAFQIPDVIKPADAPLDG